MTSRSSAPDPREMAGQGHSHKEDSITATNRDQSRKDDKDKWTPVAGKDAEAANVNPIGDSGRKPR